MIIGKTYMKASVRASESEQGLGVELFKLDAVAPDTLTEQENDAALSALSEDDDESDASTTAVMRVYEDIGEDPLFGGGISVQNFVDELASFGEIRRLNIHINSLGGDVFAAHAIHNAIRDCNAKKKIAYIDGIAASAATIVACGANEVVARENTNYMVHLPCMGIAMGSAATLRKAADTLDAVTEPVVKVYERQCGEKCSEKKIRELMEDETWMTAQQALDYGFVDAIRGKIRAIARVAGDNGQIVSAGRILNVGKYHFRNAPKWRVEKRASAKEQSTKEEKIIMNKTDIEPTLLAQLENDARTAERARLAALDARNPRNDAALATIIARAKEEGLQPQDIALEINDILEKQLAASAGVSALMRDASGAARVPSGDAPAPQPTGNPKEIQRKRVVNQIAAAAAAMRPSAHANGSGGNHHN